MAGYMKKGYLRIQIVNIFSNELFFYEIKDKI